MTEQQRRIVQEPVRARKAEGETELRCHRCSRIVSTPVPKETIVRAFIECPECLEKWLENHEVEEMLDKMERACGEPPQPSHGPGGRHSGLYMDTDMGRLVRDELYTKIEQHLVPASPPLRKPEPEGYGIGMETKLSRQEAIDWGRAQSVRAELAEQRAEEMRAKAEKWLTAYKAVFGASEAFGYERKVRKELEEELSYRKQLESTLRAALGEALDQLNESIDAGVFGPWHSHTDSLIENRGVETICEQFGYGATMAHIQGLWQQKHPGSAYTIAACSGVRRAYIKKSRTILSRLRPLCQPSAAEAARGEGI